MKRFYGHFSLDDLDANVRFYSMIFGAPPTPFKPDCTICMLKTPGANFAISNPEGVAFEGASNGQRSV